MEEEYVNKTLAQTLVWHGNKGFFVSTINKKTSAMLSYGRTYSETLVWEWDSIAKKRGDLIGQDTHGEDCLSKLGKKTPSKLRLVGDELPFLKRFYLTTYTL